MKKGSAILFVTALLLASGATVAQGTAAPKIPLGDLPTPADVMAEYADDPPVVADAKRAVILEVLQKVLTRDLYSTENMQGDAAVKQVFQAYYAAENSIYARYRDSVEFDQERRRHAFGFYMDDGDEAGHMDAAAFRLEFFDRHMPSYAAWVRTQGDARKQQISDAKIGKLLDGLGAIAGPVGAILIVVIFLLAARGWPRGIASLSADGRAMAFGGTPYTIVGLTGQVLETRKDVTTEISGGGGGGTIIDGRGTINIDPIETTTTVGDTVFLEDDDGKEYGVQLTDFDLIVRAGNRLTIQLFKRKGEDSGWLMHAYNHSTREPFLQNDVAKRLLRPSKSWLLLTILGWVGAWNLLSLLPSEGGLDFGGTIIFILVAATWVEFFRRAVAHLRFKRFRTGDAYRQLVSNLAQES